MKARGMTDKEEWFVWNGSMGILDRVTIGAIEHGEGGRSAFLAPPYDVVGPFSLDELETRGRIAFGACLVMSRREMAGGSGPNCAARDGKNVGPSCFGGISTVTIGRAARY